MIALFKRSFFLPLCCPRAARAGGSTAPAAPAPLTKRSAGDGTKYRSHAKCRQQNSEKILKLKVSRLIRNTSKFINWTEINIWSWVLWQS